MAARIPDAFIQDVLARVDIVEVIGARIDLKKKGNNHLACCPFHQEKTPSFSANQKKQFYYCFGCGAHGNAISFLMDYDGLDFLEALENLADLANLQMPKRVDDGRGDAEQPSTNLYEVMARATHFYQRQLREHAGRAQAVDYLKARGLSGQTAKAFAIGYAPAGWEHLMRSAKAANISVQALQDCGLVIQNDQGRTYDRFRERLIFPIRDFRGRTVGFGGRVLRADDQPKYLNSPETTIFHKGKTLYGLYEMRQQKRQVDRIFITEGYMDVCMLSEHGIHNVVATLGTATTGEHLQLLSRYAKHFTFCFDGDRAGREAAWRALKVALPKMEDGSLQIDFLFLPEGSDPDSIVRDQGADAFAALADAAQPIGRYLLRALAVGLDLRQVDGRAKFLANLKPYLDLLGAGVFREMLLATVGEKLGLSSEQVLAQFNASKRADPVVPLPDHVVKPQGLAEHAMSMLLQHPYLIRQVEIPALPDSPETLLLRKLVAYTQAHPDTSIAQLMTDWSEPDESRQLAALGHVVLVQEPSVAALQEMFDRLAARSEQAAVADLIEKSKLQPLTDDEKAKLQAHFRKKNQSSFV